MNDVFLKYFFHRVTFFSNALKLFKEGISKLNLTKKINEPENKKGEVKYEQKIYMY